MNKKILLADDDLDIVKMLEMVLREQGYLVRITHDGEAALKEVKAWNPHLILLDVTMPKKDGFEVLRHLKEHKETMRIPVIMLTSKAEPHDLETAVRSNAGKYITKPFDLRQLLIEVKRTLALRHAA